MPAPRLSALDSVPVSTLPEWLPLPACRADTGCLVWCRAGPDLRRRDGLLSFPFLRGEPGDIVPLPAGPIHGLRSRSEDVGNGRPHRWRIVPRSGPVGACREL